HRVATHRRRPGRTGRTDRIRTGRRLALRQVPQPGRRTRRVVQLGPGGPAGGGRDRVLPERHGEHLMTVVAGSGQPAERRRTRIGPALLWSYALSMGQFGIGGGLTFILAAILNPATFGLMVMAMVWISFILMLIHHATLPIIQQPDLGNRHFSAAFWAMLAGAVTVALLILLGGGAVAALNRTPELADVLRALAPLVLLEATSAIPAAVLRRQMRFRALAVRGLVAEVAGGAVGISLALTGYGVWALVGQQYALSLVSAAMLWLARPWPLRFGPVRAEIRQMRATA